jgi:beta-galactosidase
MSSSESRKIISLNGPWRLHPGSAVEPPSLCEHTVPVPALVNAAEPGYDWQKYDYHWYEKTFYLDPQSQSELAFLKIEQAMFGTEVWLNGKHLGGDIACYTSQEYDCSDVIRYDWSNHLFVRVGMKHTLPPESAVGKDQERAVFIPGIWGDVSLILSGNPRITVVQVIPHIESSAAEVRVTIENKSAVAKDVLLTSNILGKATLAVSAEEVKVGVLVPPQGSRTVSFNQTIHDPKLWSPESPFLYLLELALAADGRLQDTDTVRFGMREFKCNGGDFYLNGRRVLLRGGNIAFHRFLSDPDRGLLPWDPAWIRRVLIDIPREHHFNFFRNHLGQLYNRWYDIADEYGMLMQNEWQFWTTTGTREQIAKEFTRWLQDNWNHPSIIIWDALNESSDETVQTHIVPCMKQLDPTRPWESVDFIEQHPYIYSLCPVLIDRPFGYSRSLEEIRNSPAPSMVNEFLWWWTDNHNEPTALMKDVLPRWLGPSYTNEDVVARQSFLAQELIELFRRMDVDAIQPFVYLSNSDGPTGNWFTADIGDLQIKDLLGAMKNAFSPFGLSMEIWDRHFFTGQRRAFNMFVFNDLPRQSNGIVRYGIVGSTGEWASQSSEEISIDPVSRRIKPIVLNFPDSPGSYVIRAELRDQQGGSMAIAFSQKPAHVFDGPDVPVRLRRASIAVHDRDGEITGFLRSQGIHPMRWSAADFNRSDVLVVEGNALFQSGEYRQAVDATTNFVANGKTLIIIEPEFGVVDTMTFRVLSGLTISIEPRNDIGRGGYDSYVFAADHAHPLWKNIAPEHLKMFNGAFGGEAVSEHEVVPPDGSAVLARCGLNLKTPVVIEIPFGKGKVIISRLQLRGRLMPGPDTNDLFSRRADPVIQQYLLNLLDCALPDVFS